MPSSRPFAGYRRLTEDRYGDKDGYKVQTKVCEADADRRGIVIGEWYEDPDITAADEDIERPEFLRLMEDVRAGKWGGITVFKIDRLTRMVLEYEQAVRATRKTRGYIISAVNGATTETPTGVAMLRHEVGHAEQEILNIRDRVTANKRYRSEKGLYHGGGRRPFGFEGAKKDKRHRVKNTGRVGVKHVKHEVELLNDAAERIAWGGETYSDIIADWHSRTPPVYGVTGAPWSIKTLQTVMTSPRMIGKRIYRVEDPQTGEVTEKSVKAVWKPVLKKKTWEELCRQVKKADHRETQLRYLLSGIAVCGRCGRGLTGALRKYEKGGEMVPTPTYRCKGGAADKARGSCGKLSVIADPVDKIVAANVLSRLMRTRGLAAQIVDVPGIEAQLGRLDTEIAELDEDIVLLAKESGSMRAAEYLAVRAPKVAELEKKMAARDALVRELDVPHPDQDDYKDLPGWFSALKVSQRKALITRNVGTVTVLAPGRSGRYFDPSRVVITPPGAKQSA